MSDNRAAVVKCVNKPLESGDTIQPNVEIVIQRDLSCKHCKYLFAHYTQLSKQVSGKLKVSNCFTSILQPIRFNLTDTGQRDVEGEGDGQAEGDGERSQTVLPCDINSTVERCYLHL